MNTVERIQSTLTQGLAPERLEVIDESGLHAGHAGAVPGKVTHVRVRIVAAAFAGKDRIGRHRRCKAFIVRRVAPGRPAVSDDDRWPGHDLYPFFRRVRV